MPTLRDALTFTRDAHWRVNVEIKDATGLPADADLPEKVVAMIGSLGMDGDVLISSFNHSYLTCVKAANPGPVGLVRGLSAVAYNPGKNNIRPEDIPAIRKAGVDVYVWTVNDPALMRTLIDKQVSGIFTDFPQVMREILSEAGSN